MHRPTLLRLFLPRPTPIPPGALGPAATTPEAPQ